MPFFIKHKKKKIQDKKSFLIAVSLEDYPWMSILSFKILSAPFLPILLRK